jgi:hypothetical protein
MDCTSAFRQFWDDLTREGDPMRIPNPCAKGFTAGWYACEREHERQREFQQRHYEDAIAIDADDLRARINQHPPQQAEKEKR